MDTNITQQQHILIEGILNIENQDILDKLEEQMVMLTSKKSPVPLYTPENVEQLIDNGIKEYENGSFLDETQVKKHFGL